jgi:hypothetical protein
MSVTEIVQAVLTAAGGSAIVIAGPAGWLGTVWAKRIARDQEFLLEVLRRLMTPNGFRSICKL